MEQFLITHNDHSAFTFKAPKHVCFTGSSIW